MNDRYFGCLKCKETTDAGYRWAYWTLEEPHVVEPRHAIDISRVLAAREYWEPPGEEASPELSAVLDAVRAFLTAHESHGVHYGEDHHLYDAGGVEELDWLQSGPEAMPTLRRLIADHNVRDTADLERLLVGRPALTPWWWGTFDSDNVAAAIRRHQPVSRL